MAVLRPPRGCPVSFSTALPPGASITVPRSTVGRVRSDDGAVSAGASALGMLAKGSRVDDRRRCMVRCKGALTPHDNAYYHLAVGVCATAPLWPWQLADGHTDGECLCRFRLGDDRRRLPNPDSERAELARECAHVDLRLVRKDGAAAVTLSGAKVSCGVVRVGQHAWRCVWPPLPCPRAKPWRSSRRSCVAVRTPAS